MNQNRVRMRKESPARPGPVVYWMSRDQRVADNWALLFAQELALQRKDPLIVAFCLVPTFLGATMRQYRFMLDGLQEVKKQLAEKNIPFYVLSGSPEEELSAFLVRFGVGAVVTDFDPLRIKRVWKRAVADAIQIPFHEVDTHNIVPCWFASLKQEYAAYTFRPKIHRALPQFSDEFPLLQKHPVSWTQQATPVNWETMEKTLCVDESVSAVGWLASGETAARRQLDDFLANKLARYEEHRNDPNRDGQSNLSPYLHFGQLSAQRVALEVEKAKAGRRAKDAFLEELIVRRELSDNFCFYQKRYDTLDGVPNWARQTLDKHRKDARQYTYSLDEFEQAQTHDNLWNAAQKEMVQRGKMHGYMRMYWAKKILEWTESPEQALHTAQYLNDRYELDGRDPNGYVGILWSIGAVHDRPWPERPIFGKVRYMGAKGLASKFDTKAYLVWVDNLQ